MRGKMANKPYRRAWRNIANKLLFRQSFWTASNRRLYRRRTSVRLLSTVRLPTNNGWRCRKSDATMTVGPRSSDNPRRGSQRTSPGLSLSIRTDSTAAVTGSRRTRCVSHRDSSQTWTVAYLRRARQLTLPPPPARESRTSERAGRVYKLCIIQASVLSPRGWSDAQRPRFTPRIRVSVK